MLDFGIDKYGLNAYIFDSTNDARRTTTRCCSRRTKTAPTPSPPSRKGQWADVKVKIAGGALDGKTAGMLVKVEELTATSPSVRLFHTSVGRAIATWPTWPGEPGFTGDFDEYVAQKFPTSTAADFAILEAGIVSEETYVEQGLYWATGHQPMLKYIINNYKPGPAADRLSRRRTSSSTSSSASSRPTLPNGAPNPAYDDVQVNGTPGRARRAARGLHPHAPTRGRRRS